jgi:hypothetical protein
VAFDLLRSLVATHPFVDGNERTAPETAAVLYARSGRRLDCDDRVSRPLERFGTGASAVDREAVRHVGAVEAPCERPVAGGRRSRTRASRYVTRRPPYPGDGRTDSPPRERPRDGDR